jgi:hypothetical protein
MLTKPNNKSSYNSYDDFGETLRINPEIYPLDTIYYAAYFLLDKAYVIISGDPKKEIILKIIPKDMKKSTELLLEFNNLLLKYSIILKDIENNKDINTALITSILFPTQDIVMPRQNSYNLKEIEKNLDEEIFKDIEKISIPWEDRSDEKKKKKGNKNTK